MLTSSTQLASSTEAELIDDLVATNRILADQGVLDGLNEMAGRKEP